jgi:DNA-binding NarL/FixJ family response regulator
MANDPIAWLQQVADRFAPKIDRGHGVVAWVFELRQGRVELATPVLPSCETDPRMVELVVTALAHQSKQIVQHSYEALAFLTARTTSEVVEALGQTFDEQPFAELALEAGVRDFLAIGTLGPDGTGCVFGVPLARPERIKKRSFEPWSKLLTHVMAGYRLHATADDGAEAVLETDGRIAHAEGPAKSRSARAALRQAAVRIDHARGNLRRTDPDAALDIWRGLVDGHWSLIDHFDTDGRRYLVARRNDPDVRDPRALDARERQVLGYTALGASQKHIAYALGLSAATVTRASRSAMRKLGCTSAADVVALLAWAERGPEPAR